MRPIAATSTFVLCAALLHAGRAAAHFGPAEAPDFGTPECMIVADLRTTTELPLSYVLGYDDTEPEIGHIFLPDSKTHSFFAFSGAVVADLPRYQYLPFSGEAALQLPLWIDPDDVMRAEAIYNPSDHPDFHPDAIGDADYLHARDDLEGQWLEVSHDPARVPITIEQAERGIVWDLSDVPPGVYQVAGYVFSPPYNAWEPRPGLIKIIDGTADAPAVVLDSIDGMIYAGQGRRITGCVDAPAGSTLTAWFHVDGEPDDAWREWRTDEPVENGMIDLCFQSPEPALGGLVHMRVALTAPDGTQMFAYSKDALALFGTEASCTASETLCCPAPQMTEPADAGALPDAGTAQTMPDAGAPQPQRPPVAAPEPRASNATPANHEASSSAGCATSPASPSSHAHAALTAPVLLLMLRRARRAVHRLQSAR